MSSNPIQIVHQLHRDFQELIEYVTNAETQSRTAYEVKLTLFSEQGHVPKNQSTERRGRA